MAQDKLISFDVAVGIFQQAPVSFSTVSPTSLIADSPNTLFYSCNGTVSYTSTPSVTFGTLTRWRIDEKDYPEVLNQDQWVALSTGTPSLVQLAEVPKQNIPFHHAAKLPETVGQPPLWVTDLVTNSLKIISEKYGGV